MPTTYSNLESVSSATAAQNDPAVPPSLGPRNSELSWSKFARQYRSLNKSTTMPEATAEESSEPEPMDIECRLAGGALPDSGQMTVFVLLPNGTMIMLTMSTTVTFAEVKEEVFEVAASGPMYGALKDPSSYYFSYIDPTFAATKDATEESKSLAEVQPFGGMLKLLEAKEDMAATQLDEQIGRLIGKPLRDFDALRNAEVNEFRYKMRSLCEEIVKIRQGHSWLEKMKYAYPVAAESTAEVPKYLLGRLPPDGYIPVKVTFEQPDLTLELSVHHLTTPDEILTATIRKLATDHAYSEAYAELLEELEADSYYDTSFETDNPAHLGTNYYLLKINGALEYLLHNHKLIQYRTIRQLLLNDAPIHMVAIRKNSIEFEDESIYSVPDFLPPPTPRNRSQSTISLGSLTSVLINAKRRHTTFSSWSIDRKLVIRIHSASRIGFGTDKDIGRIAIMAGIFHGGELLTEHFMTSPMSESLNKSAPNLVLLDTNLMSFTWELDIVFNLKVSDLPRMARLCFAVVGFPGGGGSGKKLSKAASVAALTAKPTAKLYWGNINFFDYKGNLRENSTTLALWPFDENNQDTSEDIGSSSDDNDQAAAKYFNPLGTVVQNPATAECPLLTISFTKYSEGENAIIRYPDLKEISKTYSSQAIQQTQSQHPQPSNMSSFPEESIEESEGDMTTAADVHIDSEDVPTAPAESTFEPVPNVRRSASVSTPTSNANATAARTAWARKHSLAIDSKMAETIASAAAAANNPEMKSRIDSLQKRSASKQFLSKSCTSSTPTTSFQRPVKDLMPRTRVMLRFKKKEMMKKSSSSRMRKSSVFGDSLLKAIPEENEVEEQEMDKPSCPCIGDPSGVTVLEQQETGTQGFFTTKVEHIQAESEVVFQRVSRRKLSSQGQVQKQEQQSKSNSDDIEYLGFEVVEQDSAKECEEQQGCLPSRGGSFTKFFRRLITTSSSNPKPAKVKAKDPTRFRSKSLPERPKPVVSSVPKRRSASFSLCKVLFGTKTKASTPTSPPPLPPLNELRDNLFFYLEQIGDFCDRDLLYRMTDQECELLWYLKDDCKRLLPNALNKLLLSFKWNQQKSVGQVLTLLQDWPKIPPSKALELLDYAYPDSFVRKYAIECLKDMTNEQLSHFLLQLVQALKYESYIYNDLVQFLLERAFESQRIGHQLFWLLRAEMHDPAVSVHFGLILEAYCRGAVDHIHILTRQSECLSKLVRINEIVRDDNSKSSREKRIGQMQDILSQKYYTESLSNVINPLDPAYKLGALQSRRCKFMDSKMKPLWLVFDNAENRGISGSGDIFLIFKNGDDLRQDMLTLQMLRIMDQMWKEEGLDLRMTPYQCVSLAKNVGLIEVVLNADTIANIQKEKGSAALAAFKRGSLYSWIRDHNPGEDALKKACEEFTLSCAGYCVATYILGIADRHSDNIMVKRNGQLFHIDFGHILGKFKEKFGIRRERVPFVLTHDFVYVITHGGQDKKTEHFDRFQAVCEQAFLIIRRRGNFIISLFAMMLSTGIPEVSSVDDLQYLRETLVLDLSEEHARTHFRAKFTEALKNSWKTSFNWCAHSLAKDNRMAE